MSGSELSKDNMELLFANDSPVIGVIAKKIRNRKKKLEKLTQKIMGEHKEKTADPSKDKKREELEAQIKDLEEMRQSIKDEARNMINNMKGSSDHAKVDDKSQDQIISHALGRVADALLLNLLQNDRSVRNLLESHDNIGLKAALVPLQSLIAPTSGSLVYNRAKECFVEVFKSLAKGSEDIIPGSNVTYRQLSEHVDKIPAKVKNELISLNKKEEEKVVTSAVVHESKVVEETKVAAKPHEEVEERSPTAEELGEEDAKKEFFKVNKVSLGQKEFIDEDGFTHVKPHSRPAYEHDLLRGKGRRGRKGRHGETDRLKVRGGKGGKPLRGRGHGHHDKHDLDEAGRKIKTAHGNPNWKKGEVRVETTPAE